MEGVTPAIAASLTHYHSSRKRYGKQTRVPREHRQTPDSSEKCVPQTGRKQEQNTVWSS